jgi:hypothetical protein
MNSFVSTCLLDEYAFGEINSDGNAENWNLITERITRNYSFLPHLPHSEIDLIMKSSTSTSIISNVSMYMPVQQCFFVC